MAEDQKKFELSVLEAQILVTIDHVGWYAYLWFPIIYRQVMNFSSDAPDEQVHAAFATLIRKGALVVTQEKWSEIPEWKLAPGVLEIAKDVMSLGTDLRTRYGYSDPDDLHVRRHRQQSFERKPPRISTTRCTG